MVKGATTEVSTELGTSTYVRISMRETSPDAALDHVPSALLLSSRSSDEKDHRRPALSRSIAAAGSAAAARAAAVARAAAARAAAAAWAAATRTAAAALNPSMATALEPLGT